MAKSRKKSNKVSASEYMLKQRQQLLRRHGKLIRFNQKELDAIREYCRRFRVSSVSALIRQATMEKVLTGLGDNPPTLF